MHIQLELKKHSNIEQIENDLISKGMVHVYIIEDDESSIAGGYIESLFPCPEYAHSITEIRDEIDWEKQWSNQCSIDEQGIATCSLHGITLSIPFGKGFGDASHETTQLAAFFIDYLSPSLTLIDLGCGSGILTLYALKKGFISCFGVDIDKDAVEHAQDVVVYNGFSKNCISLDMPECNISQAQIVCNMTFYEQKIALYPILKSITTLVTSGILSSQREEYIEWIESNTSLSLIEIKQQGCWIGCIFR